MSALNSLEPSDRIDFWFGILEAIHIFLSSSGTNLFVICDNADPMDEYLQLHVHSTLVTLSQAVSFKIIAPVRPANFRVRAYVAGYNWYPHSGPSPVDILTLRLLSFVANPNQYATYASLPTDAHRTKAVCKVLEFLLRLNLNSGKRGLRALGRLVSSLAGDSIRRAMSIMHDLFLDRSLRDDYSQVPTIDAALNTVRRRYETRTMFERLGVAVHEELLSVSHEMALEDMSDATIERFASAVSNRLVAAAVAVVRNTLRTDGSTLAQTSATEIKQQDDNSCRIEIERGCYLASELAIRKGMQSGVLRRISERTRKFVESRLCRKLQMLKWTENRVPEEIASIVASGIRVADVQDAGATDDDLLISVDELKNLDDWDQGGLGRTILTVNRAYRVVGAVYRNDRVLDLFHAGDPPAVNSGKLRVLYLLANRPGGQCSIETVATDLMDFGFSNAEILDCVNSMVNAERRLVWMDRNFGYTSWEKLIERPDRVVTVSRTGTAYYHIMLRDIDYIMTMFARTQSYGRLTIADRLRLAIDGLKELWSLEMAKLGDFLNRRATRAIPPTPDLLIRSSTALDIAMRMSWSAVGIARRHCSTIKSSVLTAAAREEIARTRSVIVDWLNFVDAGYAELRGVTQSEPSDQSGFNPLMMARSVDAHLQWSMRLTGRSTARAALGHLKQACNDDTLWISGLPQDEFRAG